MDLIRLAAIARKEWIQLKRDPRSLLLAFALPLALLVFFGYAINWDVDDLPLAVLDSDLSPASRQLVESFEASGLFQVTRVLESHQELDGPLVRGEVRGVLVIPPGFSRDLYQPAGAPVQLLLDGADANTATIALNYADVLVARFGARLAGGPGGLAQAAPVQAEARIWYNPTLESKNMIVPALIAVIMSVIAALLTALTIAREWERGTMEQLASTPVGRPEVILGKLLPYLLIGMADVVMTVAAGWLVFDAPVRGSLTLLGILSLLFLTGALGFGIFISAAIKSQVLATQVAMVATYLPALLLSGFLFDIASMPRVLQAITYLVPARYFVVVTRGIFLKGVGIEVLWVQGLLMAAFAVLGLGLAMRAFRKEIPA